MTGGGISMAAGAMNGSGGMGGGGGYTGSGSGSTQSPGDYSTTLSAEIGGYTGLGRSTSIFVKGFAAHQAYGSYTFLDTTHGGISTGVTTNISDSVSLRVMALGTVKRFNDSQRDSTAYEGNLTLKENLTQAFWLREFVEYEKNSADSALFSYRGAAAGAVAGYSFSTKTLATLGYGYLVRKFEEPSGAELKTDTVSLGVEQSLGKNWALGVGYDLQLGKDSVTGASMTNNIYSLAVRFEF